MVNISAFGDDLAGLVGPVGAALAVFCQTTLNYVSERRTVSVAMKTSNSAGFNGNLPDAHLALRKVVQSLLAERQARQRFELNALVFRRSLLGNRRTNSAADGQYGE